jgi:hypothetical protein
MLFFWVLLFAAAFLGTIALVFYLTLELNEMEKAAGVLSEMVKEYYGGEEDAPSWGKKN